MKSAGKMDNHSIISEIKELYAQLTPIKLAPQTSRAPRPNLKQEQMFFEAN